VAAPPKVEWAVFCKRAERDGLGFLNLTNVMRSVPMVPGKNVGVPMFLAFGVSAPPRTEATLFLTLVWPHERRIANSVILDVGESGFIDVAADMGNLPVDQLGDLRAEFRFSEGGEPSHVAILRIADKPFSVVPTGGGGASKTH
jgi:hypothetical protein